jgi:hypothetical protein
VVRTVGRARQGRSKLGVCPENHGGGKGVDSRLSGVIPAEMRRRRF